ncbi:protein NLP2-like [Silene latifolia]|uniref:protein NLP2-like n=1 Tax=Silene latifolia TaxID=37657 RepID=UPI003D76CB57
MEDGDFTTPNSPMFGYMDYAFVDRFLDVECWSPTNDGSDLLQLDLSSSQSFSFPLKPVPHFEETSSSSVSNPGQNTSIYQDAKEKWSFLPENPSQIALKEEQVADSQSQDRNAFVTTSKTLDQTVKFSWETDELNRILWIKPKVNSGHSTTVKQRLMLAMSHLKELNMNRDVLIQMWVPVKKGPNSFLTTVEQPHFFQPTSSRLLNYRDVSEKYEFLADEDSKRAHGLPGRVFLGKVPEWTPDVRLFRQEEYPRVKFAHKYDVRGSIALPIFENGSDKCLGVLEVIMTTEKFNYRPELESICKALETVDLRSSENSYNSQEQARKGSYEAVRPEIINILRTVCETHDLPLAQTWASCSQQGNGECWHSDQNGPCVSTIDSACYIRDQRVLDFHKACSEHHLSRGRGGIVGKAFETNQPCVATDVRDFSKIDYPLAHHAKMFGLCGAVAIRLRSIYNKRDDYVLEFYLPTDLQETGLSLHGRVWKSISTVIQQTCRSLQFITAKDYEPPFLVLDDQTEDNEKKLQVSAAKKNQQETLSLFSHITGPHEMGKKINSLFEEEPSKEFKLSTNWSNTEQAIQLERVFLDRGNIQQDSMAEGISGVSSGGRTPLGFRNAGKRRTDVQKTISLEVLRKYFAGSLKDAAKDIGVCPTTLKRICRQHGIARWPSRKIKKVGHSLKKLQLVINSVQGAEGSIQLSSFYTNFPELNSPNTPLQGDQIPTIGLNDQSKQHPPAQAEGSIFSSGATSSNSASTSSSQTSISGHCSPGGAKIATTITEDLPGPLKRERSEAELHISSKKNHSHVRIRSEGNKSHDENRPSESLPGLKMAKSRPSRNTGVFKAKATFGEEKVRFTILPNMGFKDLQLEMAKRFGLADWTKIGIKYFDDDGEWVLLTCDADVDECIDVYKSSESHTIKLSLSHFTSSSSPI